MPRYLKIIFSLLLVAYIVIALTVTAAQPDTTVCRGIEIEVKDADGQPQQFVTKAELARELDSLPEKAPGMAMSNINPQTIRRLLLGLDKIEDVEVVRMTDGKIHICATPIIPVARVFDRGESYYINRSGKRVGADARYHKDVPVIEGHFEYADTGFTAASLLPLLSYIASDSVWNAYISMIKVKSPNDIILVPVIREHVINIGAPNNLDDKFARLRKFYTDVLPLQGWEKYDTLKLKWKGQLVATRRTKAATKIDASRFDDDETIDTGTMLAGDNVAPGQTVPGVKAHSEKPIPGAGSGTAKQPAKEQPAKEQPAKQQ